MKRFICPLVIFFVLSAAIASAAPPVRPFTGIGVLFLAKGPLTENAVPLYKQPAVGRIASIPWARFPSLTNVLKEESDRTVVVVDDKRWPWVLITYDDTGRKGWALMERAWRYLSWEEYLKGRPIRLLPGLKREFYQLRRESSAEPQGELLAGQELRAMEIREDWCLILTGAGSLGWIRWRDPDGRIVVSVEAPYGNKSN